MRFHPEIKEFTKNTLILTLFFTLVLELTWGYVAPYLGLWASAGNDANFAQVDTHYMGSMATAVSINIGQKLSGIKKGPVDLANDVISIAEVLASPKDGERRLIASNMLSLESYVNLLKTDIVGLLDQSTDRTVALDDHIDLLKSFYTRTSERALLIEEQIRDLEAILTSAVEKTTLAKTTMEEKYKWFEYDWVDTVINDYVTAKNEENRARVYLAYLQRFQSGYGILQGQNKKILDTLINNREALIKRSILVIPDSGSDLLKKLNLVTTESAYKETLK